MNRNHFAKAKRGFEPERRECLTEGCDNRSRDHGHCWKHWQRILKYGDANFTMRPEKKERVRI